MRTSLSVTKQFTCRVVVFGAASGDDAISTRGLIFEHRVQVKGLHIGAFAELLPDAYDDVLDEIAELIEAGVYAPGSPKTCALADGPAAMRALANGETAGKLAIDPWS